MAAYDDVDTVTLGIAGLCSIILVFVFVVIGQVLYYSFEQQQITEKQIQVPETKPATILSAQKGKLSAFGWVDRDRKIVAIPIDRAMDLVVKEQSAKKAEADKANVH